jgi:HAD superfamily hydrolase (TIGR01490 family)
MATPRPVAVFDIDGTIFRSSLLIQLVEKLVEKGIFPHKAAGVYERARHDWLERTGEYEPYARRVVEAFATYAKGVPYADIADVAGEVIEAQRNHTYRYTRDLVAELKRKGYYLLAISHSPKLIVDGFAYELGFHKSYGSFYATGATSRFTGEIEDEHVIMNKGAILMRALEKEGLTLKGSVGVGDTESDVSMLSHVERAIAFNPNRALYRHAKKQGWEIVVERKDVIYEL